MADASVADAPVWDDLTTFDGRAFGGRVDLVTAGFPCQSVSIAGRQLGVDDARWLWPHVIRVVDECGAPMLFVENVPGLLTASNGEAFAEVLGNLAARGWVAEWDCFPAAAVGATHLRDRFFMLAADPNRIELRQLAERHQRQGRHVRAAVSGDSLSDDDGAHRSAGLDWWANVVGRPAPIATLDRMDDGYAGRLGDPVTAWWDQTHAIGNGVVEQSAAYAFSNLLVRLSDDT